MILIPLGTKGQLIKMVGTIQHLRGLTDETQVLNLGQHGHLLPMLAEQFGIDFDSSTTQSTRDLESLREVGPWLLRQILFPIQPDGRNLFVLHGDAPPAIPSLAWAMRSNSPVAHIEAGERTYRWGAPFPEEIIRRTVDRYSELLLSCSERATSNLLSEEVRGKIVNLGANTLLDATRIALKSEPPMAPPETQFALASIHRFETLRSKKKMAKVLDIISAIGQEVKVVFPLHQSTISSLKRFGFYRSLVENRNVETLGLMDYFSFVHHIRACKAVITDGGGPQEESFYMGSPCLLLRETTERPEHENVILCEFEKERALEGFARAMESRFESKLLGSEFSPSARAAEEIVGLYES